MSAGFEILKTALSLVQKINHTFKQINDELPKEVEDITKR
jgi:hypothetical protein